MLVFCELPLEVNGHLFGLEFLEEQIDLVDDGEDLLQQPLRSVLDEQFSFQFFVDLQHFVCGVALEFHQEVDRLKLVLTDVFVVEDSLRQTQSKAH